MQPEVRPMVTRARGLAGDHRRGIALVAALALVPVVEAAEERQDDHGGASLTAGVTTLYNDNVARAQRDVDIADDVAVEANFALSQSTPGITGQSFHFELSGKAVRFDRFDGLDQAELALEVAYGRQFARGFYAPLYELSIKGARLLHDAELRDGYSLVLGAMVSRRVSDRWTGRTGVRLNKRSATNGEVFDLERASLFVHLDARVTARSVGYVTWIGATGDVVSTAQPTFTIIDNADAIEPDTAFGGVAANRSAYRLDADVHILTLGVNVGVGASTSLDVSLEGLTADADAGIDYQRNIARVSLLHRF